MKKYCKRIDENVSIATGPNGFPVCTNHSINVDCTDAKCMYTSAASITRMMTGDYGTEYIDYTSPARKNAKESESVSQVSEADAQKAMLESILGISPIPDTSKSNISDKKKSTSPDKKEKSITKDESEKQFCPKCNAEMKEWEGKLRCWKCGYPDKKKSSAQNTQKTGEGCFIATLVFGSYDNAYVKALRCYRDDVLASSLLGRIFIETYYLYGPRMAKKLENHHILKTSIRNFLINFVNGITYFKILK